MQEMQEAAGKQAQPGRRRKTRERILQAARELFNEQGEANVTFADIGERLGISEGNVWYHFHTKHDLIFAIFTELQTQIKTNLQRNLGDLRQLSNLEDLLTRGFHLMWDYRFLYRDHTRLAITQQEVREQLIALTVQGHAFIERVLVQLCQFGLLAMEASQLPRLATNIWIISRYWMDYCQARSEQQQITEQDIQEGIQQMRALIAPYLTPDGIRLIDNVHYGEPADGQ